MAFPVMYFKLRKRALFAKSRLLIGYSFIILLKELRYSLTTFLYFSSGISI